MIGLADRLGTRSVLISCLHTLDAILQAPTTRQIVILPWFGGHHTGYRTVLDWKTLVMAFSDYATWRAASSNGHSSKKESAWQEVAAQVADRFCRSLSGDRNSWNQRVARAITGADIDGGLNVSPKALLQSDLAAVAEMASRCGLQSLCQRVASISAGASLETQSPFSHRPPAMFVVHQSAPGRDPWCFTDVWSFPALACGDLSVLSVATQDCWKFVVCDCVLPG